MEATGKKDSIFDDSLIAFTTSFYFLCYVQEARRERGIDSRTRYLISHFRGDFIRLRNTYIFLKKRRNCTTFFFQDILTRFPIIISDFIDDCPLHL